MEPSSLPIKGKSQLSTSSPPEKSQSTDVTSSGKRRKPTIPLQPFRLTKEEMMESGMFKGITGKTPKPSSTSKKLELKPFRISEYLPNKAKSTPRDVVMPSGTIVTNTEESGVKRRLMLHPTTRTTSSYNLQPIKALFRSPKKAVSVKVSQLRRESAGRRLRIPKIPKPPAEQKVAETCPSSPLLDTSELEKALVKKGTLSDYEFKSPQVVITNSTPPAEPTNNCQKSINDPQDPVGLIDEMISAENQAFRNDQITHEEKIRKYYEIIAVEQQAFKQRQATHEENIRKLETLSLSIQHNNKENDMKSLNTVEAQSPRTKAALKMFNSLRFDHPMRTPKIEGTQQTPRRDLSMIRLGVMKECWLLQDTPAHK